MTDKGDAGTEKSQMKAERQTQEGAEAGAVPGRVGEVAVWCILWCTKERERLSAVLPGIHTNLQCTVVEIFIYTVLY